MAEWRVGIDTGGTFTDLVAISEDAVITQKVASTPPNFELGFMDSLEATGIDLRDVALLAHGTTVTTNTVLTKSGAVTGLLTTAGFRDLLELRRADRGELYDLLWDPPPVLVPRELRLEVEERIDYAGQILTPINEDGLRRCVGVLQSRGVESIAISFLHSYRNPVHELRAREVIREIWPEVPISISSELLREPREFERTATTVVNAYVTPILNNYVTRLQSLLKEAGFSGRLMIMHSGGGLFPAETCLRASSRTITSGPAGGVMAAGAIATLAGIENVLSLDMGGTSADIAVIRGGQAAMREDFSPEWGVPIRFPAVDLITIGAGGGSIAWVDAVGRAQVGPQSAGANPGPASYGRGGADPTVTDANVVLGRLAIGNRLAGTLELDVDAGRQAVDRFSKSVGLSTAEGALGIVAIANSNMARAVRVMTVERGLDPRDFTLLAFGGAGPMHACELAAMLGMPRALIPPSPGVTSALGTLFVDIVHDFSESYITLISSANVNDLTEIFDRLETQGQEQLSLDGVAVESLALERLLDLRFIGQTKSITCPIPSGALSSETLDEVASYFCNQYEERYQHLPTGVPVELAVARVRARGIHQRPSVPTLKQGAQLTETVRRLVRFPEFGEIDTPVYKRDQLSTGKSLDGPAVIEQYDSTTIVSPGWSASQDKYGNLLLERS